MFIAQETKRRTKHEKLPCPTIKGQLQCIEFVHRGKEIVPEKKVQIASSLHVNEPLIAFCKQYLCKWSPTLQGCADNALTSPFVTTPAGRPPHTLLSPSSTVRGPALPPPSPLLLSSSAPGSSSLNPASFLPYMQVLLSNLLSPSESQGLTAHPAPSAANTSPSAKSTGNLRAWGKSGRHVTLLQIHKDLLKTSKRRPTSQQKEIFKDKALENKTH